MNKLRIAWLLLKLTYRFWTGRPMNGERKTNATFRRPATHSLDPSGTALRWEMLAGWQRLVWRLAASYCVIILLPLTLLSLAGLDAAREGLLLHALLIGGFLLVYGGRRFVLLYGYRIPIVGWEKEGRREWERERVLPLARALQVPLGVSWTRRESLHHVHVPRDYREDGGGSVEVLLPPRFTGADSGVQARVVSTVAARLGMREPIASWQLEGSTPRVLVSLPPAPPKLVLFEDVRHFFEAAEPFSPFYGVIAGGEGLHIGMHSDSPHMAISAGSGAGKSEMIKVLAMQALHWGWGVIILDWKAESQEWAKGLAGVRYYSTEEDIHDALLQVGEEVDWRKTHPEEERTPFLLVCEEWSMTADLLSEYWAVWRSTADPEERKSMPTRSPALTAAKKVVFTGRSLGIFEMLVAMRFSARVTGGNADLRECFQVILMARYKAQTVKMLAPGIKPFPRNKPKEVGRWVVVMGEDVVTMRAPLVSDKEAIEWAESGVPAPASPFSVRSGQRGNQRTYVAELGESVTPGVARGSQTEPLKLSSLAEELEGIVSLKVLQKAAGDPDSDFPAPVGGSPNRGYTYDPESVKMWTRKRNARQEMRRRNG